ncbi:MAG: hypothetical protein U0800_23910 [Isosphaeraceae bacterium]
MDRRARQWRAGVEPLEGRALMSVAGGLKPAGIPAALRVGVRAYDPDAAAAILSAFGGGPGHEWTDLIRRQVPNYLGVIAGLASQKNYTYSTPGIAVRAPSILPTFRGAPFDQLGLNLAGVGLLRGNRIELGTISRGPFRSHESSQFVFAIDRGQGKRLGPTFAERPGITPDALVTIRVGPYGRIDGGTVRDLVTGQAREIASSAVKIRASTLQVILPASWLPTNTRGVPASNYKFAAWTQVGEGNDLATIGSFLPDRAMNRVGILSR